jgi:hypothetical protein
VKPARVGRVVLFDAVFDHQATRVAAAALVDSSTMDWRSFTTLFFVEVESQLRVNAEGVEGLDLVS